MNEMNILDHTGDTVVKWDQTKPAEVEIAKKSFDELKKKGYAAFKMEKKTKTGSALTEFDPKIEKIIMIPQMRGG